MTISRKLNRIKPKFNQRVADAAQLRDVVAQDMGGMQDYRLGAATLERVRKGQEPVHSAADVRKALGLAD